MHQTLPQKPVPPLPLKKRRNSLKSKKYPKNDTCCQNTSKYSFCQKHSFIPSYINIIVHLLNPIFILRKKITIIAFLKSI